MRVLIPFALIGLSACASFERSPTSGYGGRRAGGFTSPDEYGFDDGARFTREAREELSLGDRPLTSTEARALNLRVAVKAAEAKLPDRRERRQYYQLRGKLRDDRERLAILRLPDVATRARYANQSGALRADDVVSDDVATLIEAKDIAVGMSQKAVTESWGDPDAIETAGDPIYAVERWRYNRLVSGGDGFRRETRLVYFESGRVKGWERP